MNILWFSWKDIKHPAAGGAEVVTDQLAGRLTKDGHKVVLISSGFAGAKPKVTINGYSVYRVGNRFTVYWEAMRLFRNQFAQWPDLIFEEINTVPFFTQLYAKQKKALYIFQLCREIWFHELFFPLNYLGYFLEPFYLRLLNKNVVYTESQSTKNDLQNYGFKKSKIKIVPIALEDSVLKEKGAGKKLPAPTILSFGSIRSMKQTLDQVKAFEIAKKSIPELKMIIAGSASGSYGKKVLNYINKSKFASDISYEGKVSTRRKTQLMQLCHIITVTSVKEGWGLIVTEAGLFNTPAIVYNSDGLRDSVKHLKTGIVLKANNPPELAHSIVDLLKNKKQYLMLSHNARKYSLEFTLQRSYNTFQRSLI